MGRYSRRYWSSDTWYGASGPFAPYTPDTMADTTYTLDAGSLGTLVKATEVLARFDSQSDVLTSTEPIARLLMRSEAMASSRIEGLAAPAKKVLELEALDELGVKHRLDSAEAAVLANVTAMEQAIDAVLEGTPISVDMIREANRLLLVGSPLQQYGGVVRTEQNWVGGSDYSPVGAAYVPPEPDAVFYLLNDLVDFCNNSELPTLLKAILAHSQFETIHPFADGNGRTGRALMQMVLRSGGLTHHIVPPVSLVLATERDEYIRQLVHFRVNDGVTSGATRDVSELASFFSRAIGASCDFSSQFERRATKIRESWRERVAPRKGSAADRLLEVLPGNPVVSISSAARLTKRSQEACRNALAQLVQEGILTQNARNKKSDIFVATEILREFTGLERALATPGGNTAVHKPRRAVPQRENVKPYGSE